MQKLHVIYVPGLGDHNIARQAMLVKTWKWWGVDPEIFQMMWADNEPWQSKQKRLLDRIDELYKAKVPLALVGASAGASAVINTFAARSDKIVGVVCIAGKINRPNAIGERYRSRNPSFAGSAENVPDSLKKLTNDDRARILTRYALYDPLVIRADSYVGGAHNRFSPTIGHVFTIAFQISFGARSFLRFLKHCMREQQIDT